MAEPTIIPVKVPTVPELLAKIDVIVKAAQPLVTAPKAGYNPHFVLHELNGYTEKLKSTKPAPTPADLAVINEAVSKMDVKDNACFKV